MLLELTSAKPKPIRRNILQKGSFFFKDKYNKTREKTCKVSHCYRAKMSDSLRGSYNTLQNTHTL